METWTVIGAPKPQPRPRAVRRGNKIIMYNPHSADEWRDNVATTVMSGYHEPPEDGPVFMGLKFNMTRPKSHFFRDGSLREGYMKCANGDIDNLAKAVLDALQGVLYVNDVQVVYLEVRKGYFDPKSEEPGCVIRMEAVDGVE